jgi:hypothetical protein
LDFDLVVCPDGHRTGKAPSHVRLLPPGSGKRRGLGARRRSRAAAVRLGTVREGASGGQGGPGVPPRGPAAPSLFELVQQSGNSSIQAIYSVVPRSYALDRLCLVGDAGTIFSPLVTLPDVSPETADAGILHRVILVDGVAQDDSASPQKWSNGPTLPVAALQTTKRPETSSQRPSRPTSPRILALSIIQSRWRESADLASGRRSDP